MELPWISYRPFEPKSGSNFSPSSNEGQNYGRLLAPSMDRTRGSGSSMGSGSGYSGTTFQDPYYAPSPITDYANSPGSDYGNFDMSNNQSQDLSYLSQEPNDFRPSVPCQSSEELPPFNIEKDGDPNIHWKMYYDFKVTKVDSYFELQPGYVVTRRFPKHRPSATVKG